VRWGELTSERLALPQRDPGARIMQLLIRKVLCAPRTSHQDSGFDQLRSPVSAGYGALLFLEETPEPIMVALSIGECM
jgi:hypothetical protein